MNDRESHECQDIRHVESEPSADHSMEHRDGRTRLSEPAVDDKNQAESHCRYRSRREASRCRRQPRLSTTNQSRTSMKRSNLRAVFLSLCINLVAYCVLNQQQTVSSIDISSNHQQRQLSQLSTSDQYSQEQAAPGEPPMNINERADKRSYRRVSPSGGRTQQAHTGQTSVGSDKDEKESHLVNENSNRNVQPPLCEDCLAIPLVAIMGGRQVNGYIIQPADSLTARRNHHQNSYEGQYRPHEQHAPRHQPPPPNPFEPKSDEKCPMSGPLTVCEQANSYPADAILHKLDVVERQLGKSYFKIDSLFSDERDHSSDPFEPDRREAATTTTPPPPSDARPKRVHDHRQPANGHNCHRERQQSRATLRPFVIHLKPKQEQHTNNYTRTGPPEVGEHYKRHSDGFAGNANIDSQRDADYVSTKGSRPPLVANNRRPIGQRPVEQRSPRDGERQQQPLAVAHGDHHHQSGRAKRKRQQMFDDDDDEGGLLAPTVRATGRRGQSADSQTQGHTESERPTPRRYARQDEFLNLVERQAVALASSGDASSGAKSNQYQRPLQQPLATSSAIRDADSHRAAARPIGDRQLRTTAQEAAGQQHEPTRRIGAPESEPSSVISAAAGGNDRETLAIRSRDARKSVSSQKSAAVASDQLPPLRSKRAISSSVVKSKDLLSSPAEAAAFGGPRSGDLTATNVTTDRGEFYVVAGASAAATVGDRIALSARGQHERDVGRAPSAPTLISKLNPARPTSGEPSPSRPTGLNHGASVTDNSQRLERFARQVTDGGGADAGRPTGESGDQIDPERIANSGPSSPPPFEGADTGAALPEPVCRSRSIYISPKVALNDKKQWKYVVNARERNPKIKQIIRVDICQNPFGPCSEQVTIPFGFTSQCKQKYAKKKLLALDAQSGLLEVDTFFIPSCCVCQLIPETRSPKSPLEATDGVQMPPAAAEAAAAAANDGGGGRLGDQDPMTNSPESSGADASSSPDESANGNTSDDPRASESTPTL